MGLLWDVLTRSLPLIFNGDPTLWGVIGFTLEVALVATGAAAVIGVPLALAIGLGRFRGRRVLQLLANASLGVPPVVVGLVLFLIFVPQGPLGSLQLPLTRQAVLIAQTILALPYVVALGAAAVQGMAPGLLDQARALGAGRAQVALLAMREARIGMLAALIAAMGTSLSEVGAIVIVGGNVYGYDQTLASAALYDANAAHYEQAVATGIVLIVLILILMGSLGVLQQRDGGLGLRFRTAAT